MSRPRSSYRVELLPNILEDTPNRTSVFSESEILLIVRDKLLDKLLETIINTKGN